MGFLSLKGLDRDSILHLVNRGLKLKEGSIPISFHEKINKIFVCPLFFEPSTRTFLSFEVAAKKLGLEVLKFDPGRSSTLKGESLFDTLKTIESLGADIGIVRLKEEGLLSEIAPKLKMKLVNAGEGTIEHPSQAILDAMTIMENFGTLDGLNISVIGDTPHSRVCASLKDLFSKFNSSFQAFCPPELGGDGSPDFEKCLKESDVVVLLRNQFERHGKKYINEKDYYKKYGLTLERSKLLKEKSIIMHPGPFNRGVEIDADILELSSCKINDQVQNGVYARMSILSEVLNG